MIKHLRGLIFTSLAFLLINSSTSLSEENLKFSLSKFNGNPLRGKAIVKDINNVTCLICHILPIPEEPNHGKIGPSLIGVGSRLTKERLRRQLIYPKALNPKSIMPSYFQIKELYRVSVKYVGKSIYTAQQVEDVVAYLFSLKENQE